MSKVKIILMAMLISTAMGCVDDVEVTLEETVASNLPPDPGPEGKKTLSGIDSDNDGVRDDVQIAIHERHPDDELAREALFQKSKSLQMAVEAGGAANEEMTYEAAKAISTSNGCLVRRAQNPQGESDFLSRHVVNTDERSEAYIKFNETLDGQFFSTTSSEQPCQ